MIKLSNTDISDIKLGSTQVEKVYLGSALVWEKIPYDAEVEYLECDGGQYINNIYKEKSSVQSLVISAIFQGTGDLMGNAVSYTNGTKLFGSNSTQVFCYYKPTGTRILLQKNFDKNAINALTVGFSKTSGKFSMTLDLVNYEIGNYSKLISTESHRMLHRKNASTGGFVGKIMAFSIIEEGVAVVRCIPVRVGQVGYMYDTVSGTLLGNDGTGSFGLGPDVT